MSNENLYSQEAIEKLKNLVDKIDIGMVCTNVQGSSHPHAVPMSRQEVDEEGNIWFLFSSESDTYKNLQCDNNITLLYSDVRDYNFLSVSGEAEITKDKSRIEKYWNKMIETWFEKGKEDPRIRVLKVKTSDAHYWDNKTNKFVTFLKAAVSAVTGEKSDIGRQGSLSL
ncbi:MAG: pyridoxamine 5'-phosphate oxidase family protein [Agriterribacter sp.]